MPKTFDLFQDFKYNNISRWDDIKYYYHNINDRPIEYVKIDRELVKLGMKTGRFYPPDFSIKAYILPDDSRDPYHIMHRMTERDITDDDVRRYQQQAFAMERQWRGKHFRFYSSDGISVITQINDRWVYKTAWKKNDYDEEILKILEVIGKHVK